MKLNFSLTVAIILAMILIAINAAPNCQVGYTRAISASCPNPPNYRPSNESIWFCVKDGTDNVTIQPEPPAPIDDPIALAPSCQVGYTPAISASCPNPPNYRPSPGSIWCCVKDGTTNVTIQPEPPAPIDDPIALAPSCQVGYTPAISASCPNPPNYRPSDGSIWCCVKDGTDNVTIQPEPPAPIDDPIALAPSCQVGYTPAISASCPNPPNYRPSDLCVKD